MNRQTFVETVKVVYGSEPKNYTGATGHSDYVSLKNYDCAACVIQTGAWAGGTAAVTLTQATAVAGTVPKRCPSPTSGRTRRPASPSMP